MSHRSYDVIVVGLGGMGSAAVNQLARRGLRVLGLEQFAVGHDQGSSHGHTRIIRQAYYEHPDYVPLVLRAYDHWRDLERRENVRLLTTCPCLSIGPPDNELIAGVRQSARQHRLPVESLTAVELRSRYPAFHFHDDVVGVAEPTAGYLFVEACVEAHARAARRHGAELREGEAVRGWRAGRGGVEVDSDRGRYAAGRLVLTAGPWAGQLLGRWGARLTVMRQVVVWFRGADSTTFGPERFPIFIAATSQGYFYGLPYLAPHGLKLARHYGAPELPDPSAIDRTLRPEDAAVVRAFAGRHLPGADGPDWHGSVCTYTLSPDRHFLLGLHPDHDEVALAAGFSGHGFKFAPVVGEVLADLVTTGRTALPIDLFRPDRFAR